MLVIVFHADGTVEDYYEDILEEQEEEAEE